MTNNESFKMQDKQVKVLWISKRDGNGICVDQFGNEYYIDSSIPCFSLLSRNDVFEAKCRRVSSVLCVYNIGTIYHGAGKIPA